MEKYKPKKGKFVLDEKKFLNPYGVPAPKTAKTAKTGGKKVNKK